MVFSLGAPMLIGGAAFMAESGYDYWRHTHLQAVADAAAYAAALEHRAGSAQTVVTGAATTSATSNGWDPDGNTIQVNTPPTSGSHINERAVEVLISENLPRFFTAVFTSEPLVAKARAVAVYQTASNACVLALNPTARESAQVEGNGKLTLGGCDIVANSIADDALQVWGSADLTTACAVSAGGIESNKGITLTECSAVVTQAPRVKDPFKDVPTPAPGPVRSIPKNPKEPYSLQPGWYQNGMDLSGTVTLEPGVYFVSGGDFTLNGNTSVSGSGVTIYMDSGSNVNMNGTATVDMTAPESGPYAGMLFFGDREGGGDNRFNGSASSSLTGNLYFPSQRVIFRGNFSGAGGCTHIVGDTVVWSGDAKLDVDCDSKGMGRIPARQTVKIVE